MTTPRPIQTERLRLHPVTPSLARAELDDPAAFSRALCAAVPADWPPEELSDARPVFLCLLEANPAWIGWLGWYAVQVEADPGDLEPLPTEDRSRSSPVLIGSAGFKGPPDADGVVEIGYSVLPAHQGRGFATEMASALVQWAAGRGARLVHAQVRPENEPSARVLRRLGFHRVGTGHEPGTALFARELGAPASPVPAAAALGADGPPPVGAVEQIEVIHRELDEHVRALEAIHRDRMRCGPGCCLCCIDEITVFDVEADLIRLRYPELLADGIPHPPGACAFLHHDGTCRIYEHRPYVCRTQGLPLRWQEEASGHGPAELRDICPLNESDQPVEELPAEACWEIGPFERRLAVLQVARAGDGPARVRLRDLFARGAPDPTPRPQTR